MQKIATETGDLRIIKPSILSVLTSFERFYSIWNSTHNFIAIYFIILKYSCYAILKSNVDAEIKEWFPNYIYIVILMTFCRLNIYLKLWAKFILK